MAGGDLTTLDRVCRVMDTRVRPLDYALVLHFTHLPESDQLQRGALSARNLYPATGSLVDRGRWRRLEAPEHGLRVAATTDADTVHTIHEFLEAPFRLDEDPPVRQLLISNTKGPACLVTRIHHVAADLVSALMWVRHQLRVARGTEEFVESVEPYTHPKLQTSPGRVSKNPAAGRGRCDPIWTREASLSARRHWITLRIPASPFAGVSGSAQGFTYNDVLVASALDALHWWNSEHGAGDRKVGLWLPMNIREEAFTGFGNGSSRIRVYRCFNGDDSIHAKCRQIRKQVHWSRQHGEWAVPDRHVLTRLPFQVSAPLLRRYLNRPWADMGSAAFTHVERWPGQQDAEFADVIGVDVIGALHQRHALMMAAVTHSGTTWTTLTYDPAELREREVAEIGQRFEHALSRAAEELECVV